MPDERHGHDHHHHDLDGVWHHHESHSTLELNQHGDKITGIWTAGKGHGHDDLRGRFDGNRCNGGFEGDYENREHNVTGRGKMRIEVLGRDHIRFYGYGDWVSSDGRHHGHVHGDYTLHRHH
jgi:hypothetical protein